MTSSLAVIDDGRAITFDFDEVMKYHGPGYPGGVAHAFKVMQLGFAQLSPDAPLARREISIRTPFAGPGARDAFEMVVRAVSEGRYVVTPELSQTERGSSLLITSS